MLILIIVPLSLISEQELYLDRTMLSTSSQPKMSLISINTNGCTWYIPPPSPHQPPPPPPAPPPLLPDSTGHRVWLCRTDPLAALFSCGFAKQNILSLYCRFSVPLKNKKTKNPLHISAAPASICSTKTKITTWSSGVLFLHVGHCDRQSERFGNLQPHPSPMAKTCALTP